MPSALHVDRLVIVIRALDLEKARRWVRADLGEKVVNPRAHTTLVAAVKAAGLVETLQSPGPFTVFAPTNAAFQKLPAGTVETLLKPENKPLLTKVLTYHVVPGRLSSADLRKQMEMAHGAAMLKTVSGGMLWATMQGRDIFVRDEKGSVAKLTHYVREVSVSPCLCGPLSSFSSNLAIAKNGSGEASSLI